jgi:serine/threonine protein kinase
VTDSGITPDGKSFLVMQLIKGESLRSMIKYEGMDLELAATIARQLGQALTAAHAEGVIHCDLKPENIMLQDLGEGEYQVKIVDFGVAKVQNSQVAATPGTAVAGTVFYMAPEQYEGKPCQASDVFALGVITYEMLTGRRPFNPTSPYRILEAIREGVKINPRDLRPAIPEQAQDLIVKALSYEPARRPGRARDFGEQLAQALTTDEEPARPERSAALASDLGNSVQPQTIGKKRSYVAALAIAVVLVVAAAVGLMIWPKPSGPGQSGGGTTAVAGS